PLAGPARRGRRLAPALVAGDAGRPVGVGRAERLAGGPSSRRSPAALDGHLARGRRHHRPAPGAADPPPRGRAPVLPVGASGDAPESRGRGRADASPFRWLDPALAGPSL